MLSLVNSDSLKNFLSINFDLFLIFLSKLNSLNIDLTSLSLIEHSLERSLQIEFVPKGNVLKKIKDEFS